MTVTEIKTAVDQGKNVYWSTLLYKVIKDTKNQYLIVCTSNNHTIGLTWQDGVTLNAKESEFFIVN